MSLAWVPKYIKTKVADKPRTRVDAHYWNGLWNLVIQQGDHNAEGVAEMYKEFEDIRKNFKDKAFVHTQNTPSDEWTVKHDLDKYPAVTVVDSANSVVVGECQYIDKNTVVLRFKGAFSGKAYFN